MTAASAKASDAGRRAWRAAVAYVAQAPGTHILFFVTVVTTLVLRGLDEPTATRVLREASTNLVQMSRDAPRVMFLSAFLLDQGSLVRELVVFTAVLVPVERWLGTYRWLAVFAAGHVGATLATTVGIWLQVRGGGANAAVAYSVDVGVSYGAYAAAGVLTYRLPRPAAVAWASVWAATAAYYVSAHGTFTDWGHATALAIGFALGTLVRPVVHGFDLARSASTEERRGRRRPSSWRPPAVWRWLATPPPPARPEQGERVRVIAGAALLGLAAMVLVIAAGGSRGTRGLPARVRLGGGALARRERRRRHRRRPQGPARAPARAVDCRRRPRGPGGRRLARAPGERARRWSARRRRHGVRAGERRAVPQRSIRAAGGRRRLIRRRARGRAP